MRAGTMHGTRRVWSWRGALVALGAVVFFCFAVREMMICRSRLRAEALLAVFRKNGALGALTIEYPLDETLFPPEAAPPTFRWLDAKSGAETWLISFEFQDQQGPVNFLTRSPCWTPTAGQWEAIKRRSLESKADVTILGFGRVAPDRICSEGRVSIQTSKDEVGAPLFYREVNLPFLEAVKDPSRIRWRFGPISSLKPPPVVLSNLPVCGNCHSFSQDGQTLGMDVDYANSKGSYVITRVARDMALATSDIITWDDFRREDSELTYGFLSQVSPDGRFVVSTVKDRSVFVGKPDLAFSQLFFPIKGILAIYDRAGRSFRALPGADNPRYVQSNPVWSPDGKYIVFARSQAYQLKNSPSVGRVLLSPEECAEFLQDGKPFLFDLYRVPFNDGAGGRPEPLEGASRNGRSNYFPKYSPDGKWIVYCQARSYMLLQPDSELYLIPSAGGLPRRLRANTARMNSWHSWSPNGRWLVFATKAYSPYTQLCLTHIDEQGNSTPPVLLAHLSAPDRAANIPEFVNTAPTAILRIREKFLDDLSHARVAYAFERAGDFENAIRQYRKALAINPRNGPAHQRLGFLLYNVAGDIKNGPAHSLEALKINGSDGCAHFDLGKALLEQGKVELAIKHLSAALRLMPGGFDAQYTPAAMQRELDRAHLLMRDLPLKSGQRPAP